MVLSKCGEECTDGAKAPEATCCSESAPLFSVREIKRASVDPRLRNAERLAGDMELM